MRVPDEIKGVKISEQQNTEIAMGKAVAVENMTIALNRYHCSAAIGTVMTLQTVPHSVL